MPGRPTRRRRLAAVLVPIAVLLAACSSGSSGAPVVQVSTGAGAAFQGSELQHPIPLDAAAATTPFVSSAGGRTTLGAQQQGRLMLVYFGYTHCPDVCPTTMADLGSALRRTPTVVQAHTQVVFVTSDPARDTAAVMAQWLRNFDSGLARPFVGLTSTDARIDAVARSVGVPIDPPVTEANGSISVQHGAQTLAFVDGRASVIWTAGTSVAGYTHDITALAEKLGS